MEYHDRPMVEGIDMVSRIHGRFKGTGLILPASQRKIYEKLRDKFAEDVKAWSGYPKHIYKPNVIDVGCGLGIGTNILSHEAQFTWGIDKSPENVAYARQMFERNSNNIYYTPQVTFDTVDIMSEARGMATFDYVACIEVIEHIPREQADYLLHFLKRLCKKDKKGRYIEDASRTVVYLSTPNRRNPKLGQETPINEHHCYEMTADEAYALLTKHFKAVTVLNEDFEPQELGTEQSPLVYKLEMPL